MPRFAVSLISLLAVLAAAAGFAQTAEQFSPQWPPSAQSAQPALPVLPVPLADPPPQTPASADPDPMAGPPQITDVPVPLDGSDEEPPARPLDDFWGYRYSTGSLDWIPGGPGGTDRFGMFSIVWDHYQPAGIDHGLGIGMGFHFLDGPEKTDMPPHVFDFSLAYQFRQRWGPLGVDLSAAVQASSDFEGSVRKGIRFPSHAVGFLTVRPNVDVVLGVDYLDRGDIQLLPVAGLIWVPTPQMRFEAVFPRPRAVFQLSNQYRLYVSGELGGGSWAIERVSLANDLATYRDLRACIGLEYSRHSAVEVGYLFDRRLEYSSGIGNTPLKDAVLLRMVTTF